MTAKKLSAALALPLLLTSIGASADLLSDITARGDLKCAVYSDVPPFSSPDVKTRQLVGMDVDLCTALAEKMGLKLTLVPTSVEARIAVIATGRADVLIANLAYTKTRGNQIQFSDPYYVAKEMLLVKKENADKTVADFKGKRISATKGTTSEQSIHIKGGKAVTFQDAASAFLALEQNKVVGFVTNTMTGIKMISQAKKDGVELAMIKEPMALEPIGVGMKRDEPALLNAVNTSLKTMDSDRTIDKIWDSWIGPNTEYKMVREERVQPLSNLKFEPLE
ncbi:TPA: transporter substrate-binding domain-containing protein [Klebsiella michiganensis]|uniref:transporter substrate-binding domain-containing protein n=1 Tax=Klebsiella michiganensis TaxID=1134687 RepID=UPI0007CC7384|nr:transporter substrate-binding domain-containing protein [Klebsiella michiganensis]EKV5145083.1 transporter substrate-binding domain-containing protein [Klebsiella michiganensis]MBA4429600.1 transporter substrate-binding domain-containing protein [Klebsiella michiganensis]MDU7676760.1 transporter substrate-binding domain-containing protein [Klebsiella michiganensis]MEB6472582.1 transporter substrate-binding domain-containing protein [Klebsiella michiganensis]SAQ03201.1 glutamine ABC transpor